VGAHTLNEKFGMARGFDLYKAPAGQTEIGTWKADGLTRQALAWLDRQGDRPIFLFVNYFDPHKPYQPPASCHDRFAQGVLPDGHGSDESQQRSLDDNLRLYDAEICFVDEQFGVLMKGLQERHRFNDALVVVVADHGENFDPVKGISHGDTLDEVLIHVPLFVKHPAQTRGSQVEELFETRRLFHTMLGASKPSPSEAVQPEPRAQDFAVSELWSGKAEQANPVLRALIRWPLKLLVPPGDGSDDSKLYDLSASAPEATDLAKKKSRDREVLEALLATWVAGRDEVAGSPVQLDPEMVEKLKALGYLQ
jgi:arylsulfatase A-like enzyme